MELSDSELIEQCLKHGNNTAFDSLVRRYQRQVHVFCYRILGSADEASDAVQESFVKAYHALDKFRSDSPFLPWLFRIAHNTCIDMSRARNRRSASSLDEMEEERGYLPSTEPSPEQVMMKNESQEIIHDAVNHLPEKYRLAVTMFHLHGMSIREISESLNRPEGTVKSDLHHAREMLKRNLEGVVI
ncbi:MAG: RNA polymerase sigma factor [Armatimonadota bacterium]